MNPWKVIFILVPLCLSGCNRPPSQGLTAPTYSGGNEVGNGGTSSYLTVEHGLVHARRLIDRLNIVSVPQSTRDMAGNEEVSWFFEHVPDLKRALDSMKLKWENKLPAFCPKDHIWACHKEGTNLVYISRSTIPPALTYRDAAYTLIHEAAHLAGERNEDRAKAAALIAATTWKAMGHPESPHWFDIAESPTTAERLQQDPLLTLHHYSDWDGKNLVVWDERVIQRYDVKKDEWTLKHVDQNELAWKRSGTNFGNGAHQGIWIQEQGIVIPPCAEHYPSLEGKGAGVRLDAKDLSWKLVSAVAAPTGRMNAGMVKSDSKLFLWGGRECASAAVSLNDGGVYDPQTDTWTEIPSHLANAPEPRYEHGITWTGKALVVWGGYGVYKKKGRPGFAGTLSSGGIYSPDSRTWFPIASAGEAPAGRMNPKLVASDKKLFVVAGSTTFNQAPERLIHSYDFAAQTWTKLPEIPKELKLNYFESVHAFWTGSQLAIVTPSGAFFYSELDGIWSRSGRATMPAYREGSRMYWTGLEGLLWDPTQRLGFALYP